VFAGIDMRDTAAASHATETIAEEDSSELPQEDGEKQENKTLIASTSRKKTSSVSFSSDLEKEPQSANSAEVAEKPESKRSKVHFVDGALLSLFLLNICMFIDFLFLFCFARYYLHGARRSFVFM